MEKYWSEYWKNATHDSFSVDSKDSNIQAMENEWKKIFKSINTPSVILDIGTGGGALLKLGLNNELKAHSYIGLDYAILNLDKFIYEHDRIKIIEQSSIENTPLNNDSIDIAISQYAIEYSNLRVSLKEVSRLLKSNGIFKFICHLSNSKIVKKNLTISEVIGEILSTNGVINIIKEFFVTLTEQPNNIELLKSSQQTLKKKLSKLNIHYSSEINDINLPIFVEKIFTLQSNAKRNELMSTYTNELFSYSQRLLALNNAALTENDVIEFKELCKNNGLIIKSDNILSEEQGNLGLILTGTKL